MHNEEPLPQLPHVSGDFYLWLWWSSEANESVFELGEPAGAIDLWVDERLAFRKPDESRVSAVLTGENPSNTLEARAALAGGKVLQELRLGMRRDDREFHFTLKGPGMDLQGVKLPQVITDGVDEVLHDRMFLYEELCLVLQDLLRSFATLRTSSDWEHDIVPAIKIWLLGQQ